MLDPLLNRPLARTLHADLRRMEAVVTASDLDWTVVRPSGLFDHPEVTGYRLPEGSADGVFTARSDLAASMLAELSQDRFVGRAMGVVSPRGPARSARVALAGGRGQEVTPTSGHVRKSTAVWSPIGDRQQGHTGCGSGTGRAAA